MSGFFRGFRWVPALLLGGGLLLTSSLEGASPWNALKLEVPKKPPPAADFDLPTLRGGRVRLRDLRGKVVFLNFWATWCPPCLREMPSMEALYRRFKGPDFEMLALSIDARGKTVVAPFVRKLGLTFPILLDPKMTVTRRFNIRGFPTTYIIGREGNIVAAAIGPREWSEKAARDVIRELIQKREKPP